MAAPEAAQAPQPPQVKPASERSRKSRAQRFAADPEGYRGRRAAQARAYRLKAKAAKAAEATPPLPEQLADLVREMVGPEERARAVRHTAFSDTVRVAGTLPEQAGLRAAALEKGYNRRATLLVYLNDVEQVCCVL